MIRKKKTSTKLSKRKELEKERRRIAMKGGATEKEKQKLRKAFKELRRSNPDKDIRIGTSTFCQISASVANEMNNLLGGDHISLTCKNRETTWFFDHKEFVKIQAALYGKKIIIQTNKRYIGESNAKMTEFYDVLWDIVVDALEKYRRKLDRDRRRNPFSKEELIGEIRKHLTRKPPEPKRALKHLAELEALIK